MNSYFKLIELKINKKKNIELSLYLSYIIDINYLIYI